MSIHDGHRERMKKRFLRYGLDNFDDHNVLELFLFYAIPRRDVNPIAHCLIKTFGGLTNVFDASIEELVRIPGMTESAAALIRLIPHVCRRYLVEQEAVTTTINSVEAAGRYIAPYFAYEKEEVVYLLCLDNMRGIICCNELSRGVVNSAEISVRKVMELVLSRKAASVILAHNHPNGIAYPSKEDSVTTELISTAMRSVGVELTDHLVFAKDDFVSMRDSGLIR